jgi:basic amino acid/polyamine antiporter, APA family
MALTFASYAAPGNERLVGVVGVVALTAVNYVGVQKSALATRVIVAIVLLVLGFVVVIALHAGSRAGLGIGGASVHGVLQAAGLLFFAFAGYARIATLGEEVREPARTIPRAIPIALGIVLVVYAAVAVSTLAAIGPDGVAATAAPLHAAVSSVSWASPFVRVGAAVAALGSLLALLLGVSRTTFAMARDGYLPRPLASVHARFGVPHRAELAVGAVIVLLVLTTDLRGAIGFSSFGVLVYYGIANAAAFTLRTDERRPPRWLCALGVAGCTVLAVSLPLVSVVVGAAVVALGAVLFVATSRVGRSG